VSSACAPTARNAVRGLLLRRATTFPLGRFQIGPTVAVHHCRKRGGCPASTRWAAGHSGPCASPGGGGSKAQVGSVESSAAVASLVLGQLDAVGLALPTPLRQGAPATVIRYGLRDAAVAAGEQQHSYDVPYTTARHDWVTERHRRETATSAPTGRWSGAYTRHRQPVFPT
jgi:hypothetical protein